MPREEESLRRGGPSGKFSLSRHPRVGIQIDWKFSGSAVLLWLLDLTFFNLLQSVWAAVAACAAAPARTALSFQRDYNQLLRAEFCF